MRLPKYISDGVASGEKYNGNMLLIRYNSDFNNFSYRPSDSFKPNFPRHVNLHVTITDIYDAKINTEAIKNNEDLKREWEFVCEKLKNYKR